MSLGSGSMGPGRRHPESTMGLRFRWIRRTADLRALARTGADEVLRLAHEAVVQRGVFHVALAGGSTPRTLYERVTRSETARFDRWHFHWGDERCVPPDHRDSNFLMAQETLLGPLGVPDEQIHRIRTELGAPPEVAAEYADGLRRSVPPGPDGIPRFDLVLLGLGEDGHTASLFPGTTALAGADDGGAADLVAANWVEKLDAHRITLTLPTINAARAVIFLVSGAAKTSTLRSVLDGEGPPKALPARLVQPRDGTVLWIVDRAAAAELDGGPSGRGGLDGPPVGRSREPVQA